MTSEVKNLTNKLATQFSPRRDKETGVLSEASQIAGLFSFHRHSGTPAYCRDALFFFFFLKNDVM